MTQVLVYLDDIMVFGKTLEEHEENCVCIVHCPHLQIGEAEAMNHTTVVEFILLGLTSDRHLEILLFVVLLIVFLFILFGNLTVITITLVDCQLQTPMYFFLRNFSLLEICFTSTFMPRTLYSLLMSRKVVTQLFNPYIYALRNKQVREALRDVKNSARTLQLFFYESSLEMVQKR
ncbi:hypothetical protein Y1Q_0019922 [Alligator mississippiensis]|uniref:G-protein coupled receptors family 1 profile domain-containing protein n=1 Tax=Alligator mississippiensis TaxID=8496 RepID=A0A151MUF5_ALLMI|nr:hypothetical protein Y1Q_0019922 [Alligator mississippiensis]